MPVACKQCSFFWGGAFNTSPSFRAPNTCCLMLYANSFSCLKKWSTDLWPLKDGWIHATFPIPQKLAWNMKKEMTINNYYYHQKIISFLDIMIWFSLQDIPWDNHIINQTIPKMICYYTLIQWILKEILSKTNNFTFYTRLPHADPYTWKWVLYLSSKVLFVCVVAHQWDLSLILIEVPCTIFWVGLQWDGKLLKLWLFRSSPLGYWCYFLQKSFMDELDWLWSISRTGIHIPK